MSEHILVHVVRTCFLNNIISYLSRIRSLRHIAGNLYDLSLCNKDICKVIIDRLLQITTFSHNTIKGEIANQNT